MIAGVAKLLGLGVPLLGSALHVEIGNHTEARARTSSTETTAEAETRGLLRLELIGKRNEFAVAYVPQLIVSPSQLSTREPAAFAYSTNHTLTLASDFRFKLTQIGLYQSASYGLRSYALEAFSGQRPATDPNAMPRAPDGSFIGSTANSTLSEVVASSSRFSVGQKLSYRLSLSGWLGYDVAGGLTTDDQLRYPLIKGPSASLALTRRFTRATDGGVEALVRHFEISTGVKSNLAALGLRANHHLARATSLELGAGASVSSSELSTRTVYTIAPTGMAILHHVASASPGRLLLNLSATCMPVIDPTTGTFDQRLMLGASATQIRHYTQYFVSVNGATSVKSSTSASFTGFAANAGVAHTVAKGIAIEGGVRAAFQSVGDTTRLPLSGVVYVGVDFLARD